MLGWREHPYLLGGDGLLAGLVKLLDGFLIITEILLAADEDDGQTTAEMHDLGDPLGGTCQQFSYLGKLRLRHPYLLLDVVQGIRGVDSEADQDDVGIGIGERSETVIIFLASRIP